MEKRMLLIGLLIVHGSTTGLALRCHVCKNLETAECWEISGLVDDRFLKECPTNSIMCTTEIVRGAVDKIYRKCATAKNWSCRAQCATCTTDGCNHNNEVEPLRSHPTIDVTYTDILMANIYGIGSLALVTVLLVVWCIARACAKDKDEEEEEEYDDEEVEKEQYDDEDDEEEEYADYDSVDGDLKKEYDQESAEEGYGTCEKGEKIGRPELCISSIMERGPLY